VSAVAGLRRSLIALQRLAAAMIEDARSVPEGRGERSTQEGGPSRTAEPGRCVGFFPTEQQDSAESLPHGD
jgi:hypothetical protein